ncbi:MAG: hypothetical protein L0Y72_07860, partial [Gemmataceae bacterium]|nr:hypothetical protein [Gemmataceae bacterium]
MSPVAAELFGAAKYLETVTCGGLGTYTYSYAASGFAWGHNTWDRKTVETLPDGNQNIVFTNYAGQVMLHVFKEVSSGNQWISYFQYDGLGRLLLAANPSAVSGYDETKPDLLNNQSGNYQYLRDTSGLIEVRTYFTTTTATETAAGSVAGFYEKSQLKRGETGAAILQDSATYFARTLSFGTEFDVTFGVPASSTVYRNVDGSGAQTTSNAYTWLTGKMAVASLTVTLPTVSSGQNGPGSADVLTTFFDTYERPVWHKDGDGFLFYVAYDVGTSSPTKTIVDVNHTLTGDFSGLPTGWTTPTGGGLHLKSLFEVDGLGRATKLTDAGGN